ncbi:hypothetical protein [Deinococcus kurensis]|uniref:hypothetical protein n=1 Tax=Deinococcus kurensis TaxID=2662757 RepID=UPI0012D34A3E|nr:hypothetical protein [Deinococcus kurensis]
MSTPTYPTAEQHRRLTQSLDTYRAAQNRTHEAALRHRAAADPSTHGPLLSAVTAQQTLRAILLGDGAPADLFPPPDEAARALLNT